MKQKLEPRSKFKKAHISDGASEVVNKSDPVQAKKRGSTDTGSRGSRVAEPSSFVFPFFDTHRLRGDFQEKLGPRRSDHTQNTLQLINVYHNHMKENRMAE